MANGTRTYILAPTRDTPPDGPIALGNIIASPLYPEEKENTELPLILSKPENVFKAHKEGWKDRVENHHDAESGIFGQFLQTVGLGGDLDLTHRGSNTTELSGNIDTYWFVPDEAYIRNSVKDSGVKRFLDDNKYRKPFYMITGLMVLRNATAMSKKVRDRGFHAQVGIDFASFAAPITVGPKLSFSRAKEHEVAFERASDFILAFRLTKIKAKRDGNLKIKRYTKGASYSSNLDDEEILAESEEDTFEISIEDVTAASAGFAPQIVAEDKEGQWQCVLLPNQEHD